MLQGNWWFPDKEENKLPGVLSFADNKIQLQLIGHLNDNDISDELLRVEQIHGIAFDSKETTSAEESVAGKFVILQNCQQVGRNSTFTSMSLHDTAQVSSFSALTAYAIQNSQYVEDISLRFHEVKVELSHLPDFAVTLGRLVKPNRQYDEDGKLEKLNVSFEFQKLPVAKINRKTLEFDQAVSTCGDGRREYVIEPRISFKISSEEALSLREWRDEFLTPLQHFLTLATTYTNRITSIKTFHNKNIEVLQLDDEENFTQAIPFEVITRESLESRSIDFPKASFHLFGLRDINNKFEEVMSKWFKLYEDHRVVQNLLFGVLFAESSYIEDRFLNLVRAMEVYHRAKSPSKITLKKRLKHLLNDLKELELSKTLDVSDGYIENRLKDIRNHLTHYDKKSKKPTSLELLWFSYLMEYLLQALLLKEISFSVKRIEEDRNYDFRMSQFREWLTNSQKE